MSNRNWGVGAKIGSVYLYTDEYKNRMGASPRLPKNNDLCLCIEHSGDCFYTYTVLNRTKNGLEKSFKFGAYCFGDSVKTLSERDFHLLLAGETVKVKGLTEI